MLLFWHWCSCVWAFTEIDPWYWMRGFSHPVFISRAQLFYLFLLIFYIILLEFTVNPYLPFKTQVVSLLWNHSSISLYYIVRGCFWTCNARCCIAWLNLWSKDEFLNTNNYVYNGNVKIFHWMDYHELFYHWIILPWMDSKNIPLIHHVSEWCTHCLTFNMLTFVMYFIISQNSFSSESLYFCIFFWH